MTDMRTATTVGAALVMAAAGLAATPVTANAQPEGHTVKYTVTSGAPYEFDLTYLTAAPANKTAYNADAYAYIKRDTLTIGPDTPWTFEATLTTPNWAFLQAASTVHAGRGAPNAHCEITVDGQSIAAADNPYNPQCFPSPWAGA
jgi:hypothetical protein